VDNFVKAVLLNPYNLRVIDIIGEEGKAAILARVERIIPRDVINKILALDSTQDECIENRGSCDGGNHLALACDQEDTLAIFISGDAARWPCADVIGPMRDPGFKGPKIIGLAGFIGSAKTTVSALIEIEGRDSVRIINMDMIGHEVRAEPSVIKKITDIFGHGVLAADGTVDRKKLGAIVFTDENALAALNSIMSAPMQERALARIQEAIGAGKKIIVIEAAALNKMKKISSACDEIWLIDTDTHIRHERLAGRGLSEKMISDIEDRQRPALDALRNDPKMRIITNNGTIEELRQQVHLRLMSLLAKDGGMEEKADDRLAVQLRGLFEYYRAGVAKGLQDKKYKKAAEEFFKLYTVDPCAAVLAGMDNARIIKDIRVYERFYQKRLSFIQRLQDCLARVESAMHILPVSVYSIDAKRHMLPEFRAFIRCLASNLDVAFESETAPAGLEAGDYGIVDISYNLNGFIEKSGLPRQTVIRQLNSTALPLFFSFWCCGSCISLACSAANRAYSNGFRSIIMVLGLSPL